MQMRVIGVRSIRARRSQFICARSSFADNALIIRAARERVVSARQVIKRTRKHKTQEPSRHTPLFILLINLLIRNAKYRAIRHWQAEFFIQSTMQNNTQVHKCECAT
jgi:hypothetical protein